MSKPELKDNFYPLKTKVKVSRHAPVFFGEIGIVVGYQFSGLRHIVRFENGYTGYFTKKQLETEN